MELTITLITRDLLVGLFSTKTICCDPSGCWSMAYEYCPLRTLGSAGKVTYCEFPSGPGRTAVRYWGDDCMYMYMYRCLDGVYITL